MRIFLIGANPLKIGQLLFALPLGLSQRLRGSLALRLPIGRLGRASHHPLEDRRRHAVGTLLSGIIDMGELDTTRCQAVHTVDARRAFHDLSHLQIGRALGRRREEFAAEWRSAGDVLRLSRNDTPVLYGAARS